MYFHINKQCQMLEPDFFANQPENIDRLPEDRKINDQTLCLRFFLVSLVTTWKLPQPSGFHYSHSLFTDMQMMGAQSSVSLSTISRLTIYTSPSCGPANSSSLQHESSPLRGPV